MSLLFCDGFQDWTLSGAAVEGWTVADAIGRFSLVQGRRAGSLALKCTTSVNTGNGSMMNRLPGPTSVNYGAFTLHFNLKVDAYPGANHTLCGLFTGTNNAVSVAISPSGLLGVCRNSTAPSENGGTFTASSQSIPIGQWASIELSVTTLNTGNLELRHNGNTVYSVLGVNIATQSAWNTIRIGHDSPTGGSSAATWTIGDLVVILNDGVGASGFQGHMQVHTLTPAGAGDLTQFTPTAGANWQCVDEAAQNGDTDYVESSTAGHRDNYAVSALPVTPASIKGVLVKATAKKDDTATRTLQMSCKSSIYTADVGNVMTLGNAGYTTVHAPVIRDPNGDVAWTKAAVDAMKVGFVVG
jgi:hypothetical protein